MTACAAVAVTGTALLLLLLHPLRYEKEGPLRGTGAPVVGVLLYRKHVITDQPYILQLIRWGQGEGGVGGGGL